MKIEEIRTFHPEPGDVLHIKVGVGGPEDDLMEAIADATKGLACEVLVTDDTVDVELFKGRRK